MEIVMKRSTAIITGSLIFLFGIGCLAFLVSCNLETSTIREIKNTILESKIPAYESINLQITEQEWTGWTREQPEPTTKDREVKVGDTVYLEWYSCNATLTIKEINEDSIRVRFVSKNTVNRIDYYEANSKNQKNSWSDEIAYDAPYELYTNTMDGGMIWTLVFIR